MIPRLRPKLGWAEFLAAFSPPRRDEVERFEQRFAELMGQKHAVAFPYGRTGLALLLEALGLKSREIICPAYTCVVVPHAVVTSGNEPVFVDSQAFDFNMNLDLVERAITPQTGAIIATSIFGYPVDLDHLDDIRLRFPDVAIIQDCAHSFGTEWNARPVQQNGDAAIYGLNVSKLITSIFGGMVTTNHDVLAHGLRDVRAQRVRSPSWKKATARRLYLAAMYPTFSGLGYGITNLLERSGMLDRFTKYYSDDLIEMPKDSFNGMTAVEARVGQVQLPRYHKIIEKRRSIARYYGEALASQSKLRLPPMVEGATYSHFVPRTTAREELMRGALHKGVQLGQLIEYCIPSMPAYRARCGNRFSYPEAESLSRTTVNLPVHVAQRGASRVVRVVADSLQRLPSQPSYRRVDEDTPAAFSAPCRSRELDGIS